MAKVNDDNDDEASTAIDRTLMGEIEPGLWVGGLGAVKEIRKLSNDSHNNNESVVDVTPWTVISAVKAEKLSLFLDKTLADIRASHPNMIIDHVSWDIADQSQSELICDKLEDDILTRIDERILPTNSQGQNSTNGRCLVHCAFGISRSVAICAAWLISRRHMTLAEALQKIRAVRPDAAPNMGFIASLRALEQCHGNVRAAQERVQGKR